MNTIHKHNYFRARRSERGLTLIEILVSLVIGLIIVGGVWTLLLNSRDSFNTSQNQAHMLDNARYALHAIGRDLRHAGSFGRLNFAQEELLLNADTMPNASGDCGPSFYIDVQRKVFGLDATQVAASSSVDQCITPTTHVTGTDVLVVRYAEPTPVTDADVQASPNTVFVQSDPTHGEFFQAAADGSTTPAFAPDRNHRYVAHVYYLHPDTVAGDGIPSLRRISLGTDSTGPAMTDEILVSGVEDMQVQFGMNTCLSGTCDKTINSYVNADNAAFGGDGWPTLAAATQIQAVKIWLMVRAEAAEIGLNAEDDLYLINTGTAVTDPDSSIRHAVYSGVFNLRNAVNPF
ncbi:MAG: PilW family protein [Pseudomonadota bacterium]